MNVAVAFARGAIGALLGIAILIGGSHLDRDMRPTVTYYNEHVQVVRP